MRIQYGLFCAIILFSTFSQALEVDLWPVILAGRGERNDDQALELRTNEMPSFGASFRFDRWIVSVDSLRFKNTSDSGNVSIETSYQDIALWGGYSLFAGEIWDFYAVAGAGSYQQKVKTTVSGLSTTNSSSDRTLVGAGAEYALHLPMHISAAGGLKLDWTQDLEPELMPEVYIKLGGWF